MLKTGALRIPYGKMHKFATLFELTTTWESLPNEEFLGVIKWLLEFDFGKSYKKAIISCIFQRLYEEGDSNGDMFYADLVVLSRELESNSNTLNKKLSEGNHVERLPNSLLCNVANGIM